MNDLDISLPGRRAPQPSGKWAVWLVDVRRGSSTWTTVSGKTSRWETRDEAEATAAFWNEASPAWAGQYYEARPFTQGFAQWGIFALNLITGEGSFARMEGIAITTSEADARIKADLWNIGGPKDTVYQAKEWTP